MADDFIPEDLRDFILDHIHSIAQLEALLLLRRHPEMTWDVAMTAKRLYTSDSEAAKVLAQLCADELLTCVDAIYRYSNQYPETEKMVGRLADAYAQHLIPVTNLIHSKQRRIRQFAAAFKFRKEP